MRPKKRIKELQKELLEARRQNLQALVERNEAREELSEARRDYAQLSEYRDKLASRLAGQIAPYTLLVVARDLWSETNNPEYNRGILELVQEVLADPLSAAAHAKLLARDFVVNPGPRRSIVNPRPGDVNLSDLDERIREVTGDAESSGGTDSGEGSDRGDAQRGESGDLPGDQEADG